MDTCKVGGEGVQGGDLLGGHARARARTHTHPLGSVQHEHTVPATPHCPSPPAHTLRLPPTLPPLYICDLVVSMFAKHRSGSLVDVHIDLSCMLNIDRTVQSMFGKHR